MEYGERGEAAMLEALISELDRLEAAEVDVGQVRVAPGRGPMSLEELLGAVRMFAHLPADEREAGAVKATKGRRLSSGGHAPGPSNEHESAVWIRCAGDGFKKGRTTRPRSPMADREFMVQYMRLNPEGPAVTSEDVPLPPGPTSLELLGCIKPIGRLTIADPSGKSVSRKSPEWRSLGNEILALFYHEALARCGQPIGFTVELGESHVDRAKPDGVLDHIRRRVQKHVRYFSGYDVPWWFLIIEHWVPELGVHTYQARGEIVVPGLHAIVHDAALFEGSAHLKGFHWSDDERKTSLANSLRHAAGPLETGRNRHRVELVPAVRREWVIEATRDAFKARPYVRALLRALKAGEVWELSLDGPILTATHSLKRDAKAIYTFAAGR